MTIKEAATPLRLGVPRRFLARLSAEARSLGHAGPARYIVAVLEGMTEDERARFYLKGQRRRVGVRAARNVERAQTLGELNAALDKIGSVINEAEGS